jgi:hypothetical protein
MSLNNITHIKLPILISILNYPFEFLWHRQGGKFIPNKKFSPQFNTMANSEELELTLSAELSSQADSLPTPDKSPRPGKSEIETMPKGPELHSNFTIRPSANSEIGDGTEDCNNVSTNEEKTLSDTSLPPLTSNEGRMPSTQRIAPSSSENPSPYHSTAHWLVQNPSATSSEADQYR